MNSKLRAIRHLRGFTIVELLVVVSIVTLIASLVFVQMQAARARARDTQREQAIKSIQTALALYITNVGKYPPASGTFPYGPATLTGSDSVSQDLITAGAISAISKDPINSGNYVYQYASTNGSSYEITYYLETDSIPGKLSADNPQRANP